MSDITREKMLEFWKRIDDYLRSGDGDWDLTRNHDPEVEESLSAIRVLIENSGPTLQNGAYGPNVGQSESSTVSRQKDDIPGKETA